MGPELLKIGKQFYKIASSQMVNASSEFGVGNPVRGFTSLIKNILAKAKGKKK